jgi:hypothetical protein
MAGINRRRFLVGSAGVAGLAVLAASCSDDDGSNAASPGSTDQADTLTEALIVPGSAGLVDEAFYQARIDDYLAFAAADVNVASPTGVAVQLIKATRDPAYTWPVETATPEAMAKVWDQIDTWEDTRDFQLMYLLWLFELGQGETPMTTLDPALLEAAKRRLLDNRYRYDDPYPADRIDNQWFWSENHLLIGWANEYLAGQRFPDDTFTITGLTGTQHLERSRQPILDWVDERVKFGFFEWHSHVYMLKNITPLISLAEHAADPEIAAAAAMALDLALFDMAAHTHKGTFTATRGRTYKKDKMSAQDEDTFGTAKFLFDDTEFPYPSKTDGGVTYFCAAKRYRQPQAIVEVATTSNLGPVRERHGIFVDAADPIVANPEAPFGYDFADPANLSFWWSQGAIGMWQTIDISLSESKKWRMFETEAFAQIKLLSELNGNDPDRIKAWVHKNNAVVNFGQLREANTYAWRSDEVSLATLVDHRFGEMRDQVHAWQATVDADALVFTTHPVTDRATSTDWSKDDKPGYWTGEASVPRSAQHERTAVHIYQPKWDATTDDVLWAVFEYRDFTHAYVPQDRFDEVTQDGNWTFARKGDGYIALWSWRAPTWREYDPTVYATRDMVKPFDLVAEGGPDNVWIVEVGDKTLAGSFAEFTAALVAATPQVTRDDAGFDVSWASPAAGAITFGSTGPFTVAGEEVPVGNFPRHESRWATVDHLATTFDIAGDTAKLKLDFAARSRSVS